MLQIISGKFYETDNCYINDGKGILFSNYSWPIEIKTCIATIEPVSTYSSVSSYVVSYKNKLEKMGPAPVKGELVRTGDPEIVRQFQLICSFGLNSFFDIDRHEVEYNCRTSPRSASDTYVPSLFINKVFKQMIPGTKEEIDQFIKLTDKIIYLPRKEYEVVIKCLDNYLRALLSLNHNYELSYAILVYCLESLCQDYDNYTPRWEDYNHEIKDKLDKALSLIDNTKADEIRSILIQNTHLKLKKRFIEFTSEYITDAYYKEEATSVKHPVRKSEMEQALGNAYNMRSYYSHRLDKVIDQIKVPELGTFDVFYWENEPYLTIGGMTRLVHHVLTNFIWKQVVIKKEKYDWRSNLPGVITLQLAPQYWIDKTEGFTSEMAPRNYSGYLELLERVKLEGGSLVDIRKLLTLYQTLIPTAKPKEKLSMIALYCLYNKLVKEEHRVPEYDKYLKGHEQLLNNCSIEIMVLWMLLEQDWPWDLELCIECYKEYIRTRFKKGFFVISPTIEISLILKIANNYLKIGKQDKYEEWLNIAALEAAGRQNIQNLIYDKKLKKEIIAPLSIMEPTK